MSLRIKQVQIAANIAFPDPSKEEMINKLEFCPSLPSYSVPREEEKGEMSEISLPSYNFFFFWYDLATVELHLSL